METINRDNLHRTTKLEVDSGKAHSFCEAQRIADSHILQIHVGTGIAASPTRQAMLLTAVNAGHRAFVGGVHVYTETHDAVSVPWTKGLTIPQSAEKFNGTVVEHLTSDHPTLVIGCTNNPPQGSVVIHATWEGWIGAAVDNQADRLPEMTEFPLAGILSVALGISEAFRHTQGCQTAGRRPIGLSLWKPQDNWRDNNSLGPTDYYLPTNLWLIGLGHLGQAYAWALGFLPYPPSHPVKVVLQDYDSIVKANVSTGMLTESSKVGCKKTRVVAGQLEEIAFCTSIIERSFDHETRCGSTERWVALAGLDNPASRRYLEKAGFDLVVDAGISGEPDDYDAVRIHSFPSGICAKTTWPRSGAPQLPRSTSQPAYNALRDKLMATSNQHPNDIQCGIIALAEQPVGVAYVGCATAALVLSEVLRSLTGGQRFQGLSYRLRDGQPARVSPNVIKCLGTNPGVVQAWSSANDASHSVQC